MKPKTKIEILEETAAFYNTNNRSVLVDGVRAGSCVYNGPDGKHCAFARLCEHPENLPETVLTPNMLVELKPEYAGHEFYFYRQLQLFHDGDEFWNETGLTEAGKDLLEKLKKQFK